METVLIVVHLMVIVALVIVVLLQRSEGGALGIGGGGGGGFMSARGAANALSRTTAILAAGFSRPGGQDIPRCADGSIGRVRRRG